MVNDGGEESEDGGGERGRGVLTAADRTFLSMSAEEREEEYSAPARSQRRRAVADRIENAMLDFPLLAERLDDATLREVFAPDRRTFEMDGEEFPGTEIQPGQYGVPFALWFLLRIDLSNDRSTYPPGTMVGLTSTVKPFLERVERGIELWMNHEHDLTGDVDVDVSVSNLQSSDELVEQLKAAEEPLSAFDRIEVISQLSRTGYSTEEIAEILDEYVPADDGGE
jgi:hypothetical protein